ncbi:E3 SUMO-protein ligase PIAS3 isoform X1 [Pezoporus flaviventris]|uniref:E3 SUMO-protein ligase PIAS3 isoform X1 n=1 Tax=Pezoporus flaviventris TaxID=889875 RepID=UPI002AB1D709|nr:E3 SUMO-protein ligase PIAS3 isoform X1 [Pezoporus flaviventris]XP_061298688.1 E3 SUMO-protein ligase PIAS3 isoform X1 [Pezoporus flaviventris]
MKIKELYRRKFPRKPLAPSHLPMLHMQAGPLPAPTTEGQLPYGHSSSPMAATFPPPRPGAKQEVDVEHGTPPVHPLHPDVTMKRLPFYQVYDELIKPTTLASSTSQRFEEAHFTFALTPQQVQQILTSRDLLPGAKCDYTIQVQLRFCLCETSCPQEDHFPPNLFVKVNGKLCPLPGYLPPSKSGTEPKRPNRPVNITPLARLSATVPNSLVVNWSSELGRSYSLSVYLVKQLTAVVLLQKLRAKGIRNPDHSRALIKEKLTADPDSEIATTSLRVSLLCPLGKMRLRVPCRATTCSHLQCFDAALYLQMNEKKPTWTCPVCDQKAPYDDLIIDGLFVEILNSCTDCDEIQFMEDGSWCPMKLKKEKQDMGQTSVFSGIEAAPAAGAGPRAEVIDLTRDSSDEEEAPAAKRQRPLSSVPGHKGVLSIHPRPSSVLRSAPMAALGRDYVSNLPVPDFHPSYSELAGLELFSFLPSENQHYSPSVITSLQEQDALGHLFPYGSTSRPFLGVTPMSMAGSHQTSSIVATTTLQSSPTAQPGCRSDIIALD